MRNTNKDRRRYLKYAAIVLAVVFLVSAGLFFLQMWERGQGEYPELKADDPVVEYDGKEYELKDNVETFLLLGLDKFEGTDDLESYNNDKQADFLMLYVIDNDAHTYSVININRDTMTDVNVLGVAGNRIDTQTKQIALAHTYGNGREVSCRNTSDAVSALLCGIKIDHYVSLTMDSVSIYNDLVGGVEVTVADDFSGIDDTLVKGEIVTLTGEQALIYVRSRKGMDDSTNAARMKRQSQYLNALHKKTLEVMESDEEFAAKLLLNMADYIVSDRPANQLQELFDKFSEYDFIKTYDIDGESKPGEKFMEFYPDKDSVYKTVLELFYLPKE